MIKHTLTPEQFSLIKRAKSFTYAFRGIAVYLKSTHNAWVHLFLFALEIGLGVYFHITSTEWMFVIFTLGFVLAAEAFNTAIEIDIDLTSPDYHPYARDTKDVAAGAVLISSVTALLIALIIFVPYVLG